MLRPNYFATEFYPNMFAENLLKYKGMFGMSAAETLKDANDNIVITGWSIGVYARDTNPFKNMDKKDTIVSP